VPGTVEALSGEDVADVIHGGAGFLSWFLSD
jgi:hypothetical protein